MTALSIAATKTSLSFPVVLARGVLANALVCLAVWLAAGGRSMFDKIFSIVPPVAAFVAAGFERSIANMFFIPMELVLRGREHVVAAADIPPKELATLDLGDR